MDDGTEEELDIDVELLNWEDCCQHMVARVDKMWKQHSGQKSAAGVRLQLTDGTELVSLA